MKNIYLSLSAQEIFGSYMYIVIKFYEIGTSSY